jgi:hypothetical protein
MVSNSKDAAKAEKAKAAKAARAAKAKAAKAEKATKETGATELQLVKVVELFTVSPGVLMAGLDDDQYRRRKSRLILVDGESERYAQSVYRSDESLQFKVGESLMLDCSSIDKAQRAKLNLGS